MRKVALIVGLIGGLCALAFPTFMFSIMTEETGEGSPLSAALLVLVFALPLTGVAGASLALWKLGLAGILMLVSVVGGTTLLIVYSVTVGGGWEMMPPGLGYIFGGPFLLAGGILALIARKMYVF